METPADPTLPDAMNALDTLEPLLPAGWSSATVTFDGVAPELSVRNLVTEVLAGAPEPYPDIGLDRGMWTVAADRAFSRLSEGLAARGVNWQGGTALCERAALTSGAVTLLAPSGQTVVRIDIPLHHARGQLVNAELLRFLHESQREWAEQQQAVAGALRGMTRWRYEPARTALTFEFRDRAPAEVPAQVLGSYSLTEVSWLWSWANRSYEQDDFERLLPFKKDAFGYRGMGAIWRPGYQCDAVFAGAVALLATSEAGGAAVFIDSPTPELRVYYALMDGAPLGIGKRKSGLVMDALRFGRTFTGTFELELQRSEVPRLLELLSTALTRGDGVKVSSDSFAVKFVPSSTTGHSVDDDGVLQVAFAAPFVDELRDALRANDDGAAHALESVPGLSVRAVER